MPIDYTAERPEAVADTECLADYWCCGVRADDGRRRVFEIYPGHPLERDAFIRMLRNFRVFTFNGNNYDIPMMLYAASGASNEELKEANDLIINTRMKPWQFMEHFGLQMPSFLDHVDLMEPSPGSPGHPGLKLYAGRLHSQKMQEMPIPHDIEYVGPMERQVVVSYNANDLEVTRDLKEELKKQIRLRAIISQRYGVDVRSKSDAQMAEAVIKREIERRTGKRVYKPDIEPSIFKYDCPSFVNFTTLKMRSVLGIITSAKFRVNPMGKVEQPLEVKTLNFTIGTSTYQMGIGGLHTQEKRVSHYSDDDYVIKDRDVTSYYPICILQQKLYPKQIGPIFLDIYGGFYAERVAAKAAGKKDEAETMKIFLNGVFGKTGSPFSIFYNPKMMLQVTLTGQLAVLMLVERLELIGIHVISANTDGIVSKVPRDRIDEFNAVFAQWEKETGYNTEETEYLSIHSKDINNYIAIYKDPKTAEIKAKRKGEYTKAGPGLDGASGMKKNPSKEICTEAVVNFLIKGDSIEDTIEWCTDIRKFVCVERVNDGGAEKDGEYLGSNLRWYYSKDVRGWFQRVNNGNKVGDTDGARLMLDLLDHLPPDLDYDYYIREAYGIMQDIGLKAVDPRLRGRKGLSYGRLPDAKSVHLFDLASGVAICGKERKTIRDSWVEYAGIPAGVRYCPHCKKAEQL